MDKENKKESAFLTDSEIEEFWKNNKHDVISARFTEAKRVNEELKMRLKIANTALCISGISWLLQLISRLF